MSDGNDVNKPYLAGLKAQPATPESEFDPRNPNRHRLLAVSPGNAGALAHRIVEAMPRRTPFKMEVEAAITEAVLVERERCATLVESRVPQWEECIAIAAAIRKGDA